MDLSTLSSKALEGLALAARYNVVMNDMLRFLKENGVKEEVPKGIFNIFDTEPPIHRLSRFITLQLMSSIDPRAIPYSSEGEKDE